jgi:hypothetical protein
MYDMAKRSLAFTVATGGLLLTGTGYVPADAAVAFGSPPGPAQAQGSAAANQASPSSVSTPISVRAPKKVRVLTPAAPRAATSGAGAAASSTVKNSAGILSGNTIQIPIDLGLNLCGNQVNGVAASNTVAGSACGGSSAPGGSNSGSSATSATSHSGGILSGNTVQAPVNIPLNVCGNQAIAGGLKNSVGGGTCGGGSGSGGSGGSGAPGGSSATAVTDHSGGILSGNIIQAPVNVPVNACGNQANVVGVKNKTGGTSCSTGGGSGSTSGGSSATAVTLNSGGIGSGLTVQTPIDVPVNACGNQATVGGVSNTAGGATCSAPGGSTTASSATINSGGIASGTSVQTPINVPVEACGNQAGVGSVKDTTGGTACAGETSPSSTTTSVITNSGGILSGNQPAVPINVPVNVCGDQGSVVGVGNDTGPVACGKSLPVTPPPSGSPSPSPSSSFMPPPPPPPPPSGTPSIPAPPSGSATPCEVCGSPTPSNSFMPPPPPPPPSGTPSIPPPPPPPPSGTPSIAPPPPPPPSGCSECSPPPPSGGPSHVPPPGHPGTPPGPPSGHGSLAGTGTDEGLALGAAGAALLAGVGLRVAAKRRAAKR